MQTINFSKTIKAPREKVWKVLWEDSSYRKWTSPFSEGSHAVTDWKEGSKVLFMDGKGQGMVSKIAKNKPNEFMSIEHLGMLKDGKEDTTSDEVKAWAGAHENYTLKEDSGVTTLEVEMDSVDDFSDYFKNIWPVALEKVRELSEG